MIIEWLVEHLDRFNDMAHSEIIAEFLFLFVVLVLVFVGLGVVVEVLGRIVTKK